ncbi:HlyD family type I secretion periplasmic adaptor subunit [Shinella sp. S4-D37]|uniref:HlyD family type I secretion periplasmic adaptor subunit n=1 Tax=Shinella sp. S4-D37 TaxID=3161999 RepID=UPI0034667162
MSEVKNDGGTSRSIRRHLLGSLLVSVGLVVGVGGWASATNLAGAVVAPGHFTVDSYVKKVQHPTGGVVGEIRVHEGDKVKAGDVVLRLDATATRANLAIVARRLDEFRARYARLEAERDDLPAIVFLPELVSRRDTPEIDAILRGEERLFTIRLEALESKKAQLRERIVQYQHEIEGLKAQEIAYDDGIAVLDKEIASLNGLREQGAVSDQRLNSLKTQRATFGGERGEKVAYQAQAAGRITETKLQILQVDQDLKAEVGRELRDTQAQIGEYVERMVAAEDELKRIDIVAPQSGTVHQLQAHTVGGVITPADPIMLIVPESDDLALEVRIQPRDIDQILPGQAAVLRMSAFNQRTTPELKGHVSRVAADLTTDERNGLSYYVVRIAVPPDELKKLDGLTLVPGMPAEAFIQTSERTALSYLVKPLADQLDRAFREE